MFTVEEITEVVQTYALPGNKWKRVEQWRYDRFIEVQMWDNRPIWEFVK